MSIVFAIPNDADLAGLDWYYAADDRIDELDVSKLGAMRFDACFLVVSGRDAYLDEIQLSARNYNELRSAALFHLEDDLAETIADLHAAFGPKRAETSTRIVQIVSHTRMTDWLDLLKTDLGDRSDDVIITSDTALLHAAGQPVLFDGDGTVLYSDGHRAYAMDANIGMELLPALLQDAEIEDISVFQGRSPVLDTSRLTVAMKFEDEVGYPEFLARYLNRSDILNLRQGDFKADAKLELAGLKPWRATAVLGSLAAVLAVAFTGVSAYQLNAASGRMFDDAVIAYQAMFPDEGRVIDPAREVDKKLSEAGASLRSSGNIVGFLSAFYRSVRNVEGVQIVSVSYNQSADTLSCALQFGSFEDRDAFKQQVESQNLTIQLGGVTQETGMLSGQAVIGRAL